ncbi:transcription termination/antitermination protein NusG [Methylobacterium nodulans]|uniref:NusG antitermination factor n=1 Tax=Methylobacterium nodulans (strain LMG 21967 / CNCM I-2342 / ORS 2060) TaxID=460265 RepID=B8IAM8_METNO|nr:transcription termination/antitermination protein NusG [Methylobacterium nodulans]ACL61073.1 NusG antitermination factor [Methylobacterium nodulans ORS 2060]
MTPEQRRRRRRREKARRERARITAEAARRSLHAQGEQRREALAALAADARSPESPREGRTPEARAPGAAEARSPAQGPGIRPESPIERGRRWHVMVAKPRFARRAAKDLTKAGIPAVLTDERVELVEESGRRRIVKRPLLRRVLFVGLPRCAAPEVVHRETYFVRDAVRDGCGRAIQVPADQLRRFVRALADTLTERDPNAFEPGDEIRIKSGPFASFHGIIEDADYATRRLKVAVEIFGRPSPVGLDFSEVERA